MVRIISGLALLLAIFIYGTREEKILSKDVSSLSYVSIDTTGLLYKNKMYVPVNLQQKNIRKKERLILKVRNTSLTDSIYVNRVDYYDSEGRLLTTMIDSTLLVKPMATSEIVVSNKQFKESGDNLIVEWLSNSLSKPMVQAILVDSKNRIIMNDHGILLPNDLTATE